MGRRVITNLILSIAFGISLAIIYKYQKQVLASNPIYELASIQSSMPERILEHTGYTVSYNTEWRIPNWVAYELTAEEVAGTIPRENNFRDDPLIYGEAESDTYTNSGYDRGHMAPAGDMKWNKAAMDESFYMTNICPQNHNLNGGDWKDLEEHIRTIATQYDHIYICCGPIVGENPKYIGSYSFDRIVIPDAFFKVLLRQKDSTWTTIGFKMENKAGHNALATYALSVDDLETLTNIDFFYNLPDSIEELVEKSYSLSDWNIKKPLPTKNKGQAKKSNAKKEAKQTVQAVVAEIPEKEEPIENEVVMPEEAIPVEEEIVHPKEVVSYSSSSSYQGTSNGRTIHTGPRGGRYYYNSKGKKVYIKR